MPWWSINPASEPPQAVNLAASSLGTTPDEITGSELAEAYNQAESNIDTWSNSAQIEKGWDAKTFDSLFDEEEAD